MKVRPAKSRKSPKQASKKKQSSSSTETLNPSNVLHLQQTVGNQAVLQMLQAEQTHEGTTLQRMPNYAQALVQSSAKGRKTNFGTTYQNILDGIRRLDNIYDKREIGGTVKEITTNFKAILAELDTIEGHIHSYLAGQASKGRLKHVSETRTRYAKILLGEIAKDRRIIARTMLKIGTPGFNADSLEETQSLTPRQFIQGKAGLANFGRLSDAEAQRNDDDGSIKKVGGGTNELTVMNDGYFKQNIDDIDPSLATADSMGDQNLWYVSQDAGIHNGKGTKNARMANRDVAMSRLDQLLGANVIAKSESMIYKLADESEIKGVLSANAGENGIEAGAYGDQGNFVANADDARDGKTHIDDPGLQRFLSRLQLIDNIAFQVDRQNSNYYLQFDDAGRVIGITGIDNDMAMGTKTDLNDADVVRNQAYPGLSLLVDRDLAQAIQALDHDVLAIAMADLLTPLEIGALLDRLSALKGYLKAIGDANLLRPDQWNEETATRLREEDKSYFASLAKQVARLG